ncbi:MAG: hypothetical protein K8S98_00470 [Planctomycetes bacterium]|nr:hypothetical protein [Planctomycetota bacterium]
MKTRWFALLVVATSLVAVLCRCGGESTLAPSVGTSSSQASLFLSTTDPCATELEVRRVVDANAAPVSVDATTGAVELRFHGARSAAIRASLEFADDEGSLSPDARRRLKSARTPLAADDGGRIRWTDLPPGAYRWSLASPTPVVMSPRAPNAEFRADGTIAPCDATLRHELSDAFDVAAGRVVSFDVTVLASASVTGVVLGWDGQPVRHALVTLKHDSGVLANPNRGPDFRTVLAEGDGVETDAFGLFEKGGLRPGSKLLSATWRDAVGLSFVTAQFSVVEGERVDLGGLVPAGESVEFVLRFEVEGAVRSCRELGLAPPAPRVLFASDARTVPFASTVSTAFECEMERPFVIRGLAAGGYDVTIPDGAWFDGKLGEWELVPTKLEPREFAVPTSGPLEFRVRVRPRRATRDQLVDER